MKLLLTSTGLANQKIADFFVSILLKEPKGCSVLMVSYIRNKQEQIYVNQARKELIDLGMKNISIFSLKDKKFNDQSSYDVIYVCGGNTYAILNRMRITGIDNFIKKAIDKDGSIYFGVSAGSIIAGPNINIAGWGSEGDENEVNLKDLTGFNFTNISIFPHFKTHLKREVEEYKNKANNPVIELTDDEAVFIHDSDYKIIK